MPISHQNINDINLISHPILKYCQLWLEDFLLSEKWIKITRQNQTT